MATEDCFSSEDRSPCIYKLQFQALCTGWANSLLAFNLLDTHYVTISLQLSTTQQERLTADGRPVWWRAHELSEVNALSSCLSMAVCLYSFCLYSFTLLILLALHCRSSLSGCL